MMAIRGAAMLAVLWSGIPARAGSENKGGEAPASTARIDDPLFIARLMPSPATSHAPVPIPLPNTPVDMPAWSQSPDSPTFGERLDDLHDESCVLMQNMFDRIDHWFAKPGNESLPELECPFFIGLESETLNRGKGVEFLNNVKFDMKLRLPNVERRLHLIFTTEPLDEFVTKAPGEGRSVTDDGPHEFFTGVRRQLDKIFDVTVGVKAGSNPELFAALKWSTTWHPGEWTIRPSLKEYWTSKEGIGTSGGLLVERFWGSWLVRSATGARCGEETRDLEWNETMTVGYVQEQIQDHRFGSLAQARDFGRGYGLCGGVEGHGSMSDAYSLNVFKRMPLRGKWLYLHIAPEIRMTQERNWAMDYGIRIGLDFVFSARCNEPEDE
jgi:hypothetical protein